MHNVFGVALLLAAAPFWEAKPPAEWSNEELTRMVTDSPWGQSVGPMRSFPGAAPVAVFFASAKPVRMAEEEARKRYQKPGAEGSGADADFREFLEKDDGKSIVIAVQMRDRRVLAEGEEMKRMERESVLRLGRRKYHVMLQFSPGPNDPFLRLVFPREVEPADRRIDLSLYVPGEGAPYREASFSLKDMMFEGKLEL
jgi:hypothetical protein